MKIVQWDMKERFVFPVATGMPAGVETVNVTPMFTIDRTDDAVRLTGIYHIAATMMLDEAKKRTEIIDSAILIDDVEVVGETGYFEYAVPFNIDLPPEANDPLDVTTDNTSCKIDGQGTFAVAWDVECAYLERVAPTEEELAIKELPVIKEQVITKEIVLVKEQKVERQAPEVVEIIEEVAEAPTAVVLLESTSFNDMDEVLSFIEGLDDGISLSLFRSNDVFVQSKT